MKAKTSNLNLLKSPETLIESKQGVFIISAQLEIIKGQLETLNGLVLDLKTNLEHEIKVQDENSIDIVFENILSDPNDTNESFTSSATNASLHSMYKTVENIQEIIKEVDLAL